MRKNEVIIAIFKFKSWALTKILVKAIKTGDIKKIEHLVSSHKHGFFDIYYKDADGNNLMRLAAIYAQENPYLSGAKFSQIILALNAIGCRIDIENLPAACLPHIIGALNSIDNNQLYDQRLTNIENLYGNEHYFYGDQSRIYPGVRLTDQLALTYGSKKPHKACKIPDACHNLNSMDHQEFTLHERLALAAAAQSEGDDSVNNYVTINIGFIVSTILHQKDGEHSRRFVTIPLRDPRFKIFWEDQIKIQVHSEEILYQYLLKEDNLQTIINDLKAQGILPGFKIYAIILDIHSKNNMCNNCTSITLQMQHNEVIKAFENSLNNAGYVLPKEKILVPDILTPFSRQLHIVTRISSVSRYDGDYGRPISKTDPALSYPVFTSPSFDRDIKKFGNAVVIKDTGQKKYAKFWSGKPTTFSLTQAKTFAYYNQTAFINFYKDASHSRLQGTVDHTTDELIIFNELKPE